MGPANCYLAIVEDKAIVIDALQLFSSINMVKFHRRNVYRKNSWAKLIDKYRQLGEVLCA